MLAGRAPAEQAFLLGQHLAHADAVVADAVQAQLVGMVTRADLDHGHHPQQPAVDLDVALHDDRVREKRRTVGAEAQVGVAVLQLGGHQHRDAGAGQRRHKPEQRLAEVGSEGRRQGELETAERIEHDAARLEPPRLGQDQQRDLVDRQVRLPAVDQTHLVACNQVDEHGIARPVGMLLEGSHHTGFAATSAFRQEGGGEDALAGP